MDDAMRRIANGELVAGDGSWYLVDVDLATGARHYMKDDGVTQSFMKVEDNEPLFDRNQEELNASLTDPQKGYRKIASIPMSVFMNKLYPAVQQEDHSYLARWLNDPDNAGYRTHVGREDMR